MTRRTPPCRHWTSTQKPSPLFEPLRFAFAEFLFRLGYPNRTRNTKVSQVRCFVLYLEARGRKRLLPLSHAWAQRYVRHRLATYRQRRGIAPPAAVASKTRGALRDFYEFLELRGGVPRRRRAARSRAALTASAERYFRFLRDSRGLRDITIACRRAPMKRFLSFVRRAGKKDPRDIDLELVDAFFTRTLPGSSSSMGNNHITTVTGYLRFLFLIGVHPRNLAPLIERPVSFRQARLPRTIEQEDIRRVLSKIDRGTSKGRRDRAMFLLLVALGLRPQEVALLRTSDVDLDRGVVSVPAAKSSPVRRLPLPRKPRRAIDEYLRGGRPADASSDRLFLTVNAPWRPLRSGASVAVTLGRYFTQAGLSDPRATVYSLRHAFAQRLLDRKVSLAVIRDLMGHRSIETTCLYLKVDLRHLQEVADLPTVHHLADLLLDNEGRAP